MNFKYSKGTIVNYFLNTLPLLFDMFKYVFARETTKSVRRCRPSPTRRVYVAIMVF